MGIVQLKDNWYKWIIEITLNYFCFLIVLSIFTRLFASNLLCLRVMLVSTMETRHQRTNSSHRISRAPRVETNAHILYTVQIYSLAMWISDVRNIHSKAIHGYIFYSSGIPKELTCLGKIHSVHLIGDRLRFGKYSIYNKVIIHRCIV